MMGVKYFGTFLDHSGYGSANRSFITALFMAGVDVTTEVIHQVTEQTDFGWTGRLCQSLEDRQIDYKIKILHITPDMYPKYMEPGKYHIGHLFWETDKLPKEWIAPCNKMNEIWTASEPQAQMIKNSGVKVPIKWFPQPVDIVTVDSNLSPLVVPNFEGTIFLSVFQWILRKNPEALIKTYLKTFSGKEDVCLVLKTYRMNYSDREFNLIKEEIKKWKQELNLPHYPKIYLVNSLLTQTDMVRLYKNKGVFVTTSTGEGWQRPAVEASLMGNPVIAINQTGFADYFSKELYYPVPANLVPVRVDPHIPWYAHGMFWLEVDREALANAMLSAYTNQAQVQEKGKKAASFVKENFNFFAIGAKMKQRLEEVSKFI